ncbi:MAG: nucleoside-diphosphate-sugar epimerase [Myxococcota bacterium]|jgi:nucleoside-diphosphate-sugar epimerase
MKALVTGGGGFLGRRIVELLVEQGHTVRFVARGQYPEVEALGAEGVQADLRDPDAMLRAAAGMDTVFHVAAKAGYWGPLEEFSGINVDGTRNVIAACRASGAGRLIYTSTPSVIGYAHEVEGIAEAPYPDTWESPYGHTKAAAEREVLAANGPDLATVSLRPHLIIGPRDNNLLPRVVDRARQGRMMIVGAGDNTVDITYVDNAAWAHLDAAEAMTDSSAACAGKAYFISNDEPVKLWDWVNDFLPRVGAPPVSRHIGFGAATALGHALELAYTWLPLSGEPRMTRFVAAALARSHWYDMSPAKQDFGYRIRVPLAEGTERTVAWFNEGRV